MTAPLNVAMLGASGRMGRSIIPLLLAAPDLHLSGALAAPDDASIGVDAGVLAGAASAGVAITADPTRALDGAGVAIEFALPQATMPHARLCADRSCAMVIGTTGHEPAVLAATMTFARNAAIASYLATKAVEAGLTTDRGLQLLEAAHRAEGRSERANLHADMTAERLTAAERARRSSANPVHARILNAGTEGTP